jgi:hypothetical protein
MTRVVLYARYSSDNQSVASIADQFRVWLMAPEVAAEAMRAFAEETNRLNRERRSSGSTDRKALADIEEAQRNHHRHRGRWL